MSSRGHKDLQVWQKSMELAVQAYQISRLLPGDERFGLTSQIQRAAVSIPANIAEGHGRHHSGDFLRFLYIANGSLRELETHLELAERLNYLSAEQLSLVYDLTIEVGRKLAGLINSLKEQPK
jgi:four helix bundle protein